MESLLVKNYILRDIYFLLFAQPSGKFNQMFLITLYLLLKKFPQRAWERHNKRRIQSTLFCAFLVYCNLWSFHLDASLLSFKVQHHDPWPVKSSFGDFRP